MEPAFILAVIISGWMLYRIHYFCSFCHRKLTPGDRMANGRIRFRRRGTNFPVCRCCAQHNPEDVE